MSDITISRKGWIVNTTNEVHGMLEQGGISGRRVLVPHAVLSRLGIDAPAGPDAPWNEHMTQGSYVAEVGTECAGVRVLRKGHRIY